MAFAPDLVPLLITIINLFHVPTDGVSYYAAMNFLLRDLV